jgi:hypothetical protein
MERCDILRCQADTLWRLAESFEIPEIRQGLTYHRGKLRRNSRRPFAPR